MADDYVIETACKMLNTKGGLRLIAKLGHLSA